MAARSCRFKSCFPQFSALKEAGITNARRGACQASHRGSKRRFFQVGAMQTQADFENEEVESVDYFGWFQRVVGWDAILPFLVSIGSIGIANVFKRQPPADIFALCGLPVVGFLIRLAAGSRQINRNACGSTLRRLQVFALIVGLYVLAVVDFFTALSAFVPNGNNSPDDVTAVCVAAFSVYFMLATFAMYPGRPTRRFS